LIGPVLVNEVGILDWHLEETSNERKSLRSRWIPLGLELADEGIEHDTGACCSRDVVGGDIRELEVECHCEVVEELDDTPTKFRRYLNMLLYLPPSLGTC
jgi:hypothetical protein